MSNILKDVARYISSLDIMLTAFAEDANRNFKVAATYWQGIGQSLITDIANYKAPVVEADADYSARTRQSLLRKH
jgi:hypothetical protein